MSQSSHELKAVMEGMIESEIRRLVSEADICVFALYDPNSSSADPIDFICHDARTDSSDDFKVSLAYEGVGVWYIAFRDGDVFRSKKILLKVTNGRFTHGQMGTFEGFWDEFPQYVAEDRWVHAQLSKNAANDLMARA